MPFTGFMQPGDPRGPLFASGGATWPTCPAWRYRLGSEDASGSWSFLRTTGILFEATGPSGHDFATWAMMADAPPCFTHCEIWRTWVPIVSLVRWTLRIITPCHWKAWRSDTFTTPGAANKDVLLKGLFTPRGPPGDPGTKLTLYQVEFDEETTPGGWPPWE